MVCRHWILCTGAEQSGASTNSQELPWNLTNKKSCDKRGKEWSKKATATGIKDHVQRSLNHSPICRRSPQVPSQQLIYWWLCLLLNTLISFLLWLFWTEVIFVPWNIGTFLLPPPHQCFTQCSIIHCKQPSHQHWTGRTVPGALTALERAGHGHIEDHCLIYILWTKLKLVLPERVTPSPQIVPERFEISVCF